MYGVAQVMNCRKCMVWCVAQVMYMAVRQFFQAVQIVLPATIVSAATIAVNVGLNALLVNGAGGWGGMGLQGSPLATLVSMLFQLGSFLCFTVLWKKYHAPFCSSTFSAFRCTRLRALRALRVLPAPCSLPS